VQIKRELQRTQVICPSAGYKRNLCSLVIDIRMPSQSLGICFYYLYLLQAPLKNLMRKSESPKNHSRSCVECHTPLFLLAKLTRKREQSTALGDKKALRKQRKVLKKESIAKALQSQPLRKINTEGLQCLQQSLNLLSDFQNLDPLDNIFIAIDFEYSHFSAKTGSIRLREVEISILDTRALRYKNPEKLMTSQHYRTVTDTKQFLFGTSVDIAQDELVSLLRRLLFPEDEGRKKARKIFLVGHGFGFEI
jgi:hypothetical protein